MPLNLVPVACHRFKRTQADPLCLPEILVSEYVLISPYEPVSHRARDLSLGPPHPDGHRAHAHCSPVEKPIELPRPATVWHFEAFLWCTLCLKFSAYAVCVLEI